MATNASPDASPNKAIDTTPKQPKWAHRNGPAYIERHQGRHDFNGLEPFVRDFLPRVFLPMMHSPACSGHTGKVSPISFLLLSH